MKKQNDWEIRLNELEVEVARLSRAVASLRQDYDQEQSGESQRQTEYEALREAVVRYAVACGAVEVQMAMMRARPVTNGREEALKSLNRALDEQNEASEALRAFARGLQQASGLGDSD